MILANLRARFVTTDTDVVVELLSDGDPRRDQSLRDQVAREGVEVLLDNEALPERLRTSTRVFGPSPALFIYVTVRHALLSVQIDSRLLSDYLGALLFEFGRSRRAYQIARYDDESFHYLTDIVAGLESHRGRRGFLLRAHLGNFSLWMAGIFPEYIAGISLPTSVITRGPLLITCSRTSAYCRCCRSGSRRTRRPRRVDC